MGTLALKYSEQKLLAPRTSSSQAKWQRITLMSVLGYEGLGGITGGTLLIASPDGKYMDMPVGILHGIFSDFLIPGIILFGMGLLTIAAFISVFRRTQNDWFMAWTAIIGWALWFWIEIAVLLELHWLHAMWGLPVVLGGVAAISLIPNQQESLRKAGLVCGILASLLYVAVNIIVTMQWEAYDWVTQTVSELSAIDAPTRTLWMVLCTPYTALMIAFAWGIWRSAKGNPKLRIPGGLLIAYGVLGVFWPLAPMHLRETLAAGGGTISDTMHLVLAGVTQVIYLLALWLTATALGKQFRLYSIATFVVLLVFGFLTFLEAPNVSTNGPTPMIGIWERINIGVFMLWVIVLAIKLLPAHNGRRS